MSGSAEIERQARQADPARGASPRTDDDRVRDGRFSTTPRSEGVGNLHRKGVKIFPKTGGADLSEIARHFLTMPSQHPVDDWGDPLD